jgi:uncharacterized membrane protein YbhN (UPF0104 family)
MAMVADKIRQQRSTFRRFGLGLVIILLALYVLLPQVSALGQSLRTVREAYMPLVVLGVFAWLLTYVSAALTYLVIATRRISFRHTLLAQVASGFTNRLVPAGAGAIAVNTQYLIRIGYRKLDAAGLTVINNIIGAVANFMLLAVFGLGDDSELARRWFTRQYMVWWVLGIFAIVGVLLALAWLLRGLPAVRKWFRKHQQLLSRPYRLVAALIPAAGTTLGYAGCLLLLGQALNVHLSMFDSLVVLSAGVAAASVVPTPGGLGGAEAALTAALVALHVSPHQAVALALLYRLVTYWLPVIPGVVALRVSRRSSYI